MADDFNNPGTPQPPATAAPPPASSGVPMVLAKPKAKRGRFSTFLGYLLFARGKDDEIVIISHSPLFYWWPVWFFGYVMAAITFFHNTHAAFVPDQTTTVAIKSAKFDMTEKELEEYKKTYPEDDFEAIVAPKKAYKDGHMAVRNKWDVKEQKYVYAPPTVHSNRLVGGIFLIVLLLVIIITNVPLRGLWSLIVIVVAILGTIILAQAGVWDRVIAGGGRLLGVHINLGGYMVISTALLALWLVNFFFFDRQFYMIFTPGQVRVHLEIGGGETAYDTTGIVFQKQRSDIFRHYILGFGSGDLIIRPSGGKEHIDMHNVLNVGRRVREIERALQERQVVAGQTQG